MKSLSNCVLPGPGVEFALSKFWHE